MKKLGIIGHPLSHSFSPRYFSSKFEKEGIEDYLYKAYDLEVIKDFPSLLNKLGEELKGLNVTIPYKEKVLDYLAGVDPLALRIGAVNTLKWTENGWIGFNTDHYGFTKSLAPLLETQHEKALVLGTGGASKSISAALEDIGIDWLQVSRNPRNDKQVSYGDLNEAALRQYPLIINTTPLGTSPNIEACPDIPYEHLSSDNLLFDLVYNPEETTFMKKGKEKGAKVSNGYNMLVLQAEKAWEIWHQ